MAEVRRWFVALLIIGAAWICALVGSLIWAIYNMPSDEPPAAFGVGPLMLIPVAFILIVLTAIWLAAAAIHAAVVLARRAGILRSRTSIGDTTYP